MRTLGRTRLRLHLGSHDPADRKVAHFAHKVAISLLFNQLKQGHSLIGHLRLWFRVSQPKPLPKIDDGRHNHHRLRAALRRGLRARPLIPTGGHCLALSHRCRINSI
jgi:hypothetical protein